MELPAYEALLDEEESSVNRKSNSFISSSWDHPSNLDSFFTNMYTYQYQRGLSSIVLNQICSIITLGFTVAFSSFLIAFIDWESLLSCDTEDSCEHFEAYIIKNPFRVPSFHGFISLLYILLFGIFWVWSIMSSLHVIIQALEMEKYYREILHIENVEEVSWNDVLETLIKLHEQRIHRVAVKEKLTEHDIVSRIMRKENYMIAFVNKQILDIKLPWWISPFVGKDKLFLTKSLEWSIHFCILQHMFDESFRVSKLFKKDVDGLQLRLVVVGAVHLTMLPFMLIFMVINFFLQNASEFHSSKAYLGPRKWSPFAMWKFREFNELPHVFEERMNKAIEPTNNYVSLFRNPLLAILARCVAYITGSIVAALLLASIFEQGALIYVRIGDHNLLWYLGIFSALFAGARSMVPDDSKTKLTHRELVEQFSSHTHYLPETWVGNENKYKVKDEVFDLFPFKTTLFGYELLSVIFTPMVLCFSLPNCVPALLEFITKHTVYIEGVGDVCDYSCFDFDTYGDVKFGAAVVGKSEEKNKPKDGKLEKSFINFQLAHPHWKSSEAGKSLLTRLNTYKNANVQNTNEEMANYLEKSINLNSSSVYSRIPGNNADINNQQPNNNGLFMSQNKNFNDSKYNFSQNPSDMPSVLLSILKQEDIDYQNDFYWLTKFQQKRKEDPQNFEQSLSFFSQSIRGLGSLSGMHYGSATENPSSPPPPSIYSNKHPSSPSSRAQQFSPSTASQLHTLSKANASPEIERMRSNTFQEEGNDSSEVAEL